MTNPDQPILLTEATVQEIQLELLRRTRFNALDGERVVASLRKHRHLWEAVMLDRLALSEFGSLPRMGLIKLRDLSDNFWNADTLYVLTHNAEGARKLAEIINSEDWGGEVAVYDDPKDVDGALGSGRETRAIVSIWWD